MNDTAIEKLAETILLKENIFQPGVKADHIAEFGCDLEIEWIEFNNYPPDVKILAAINFGDKKIYMNESCEAELKNNLGRMNFTIAHELGHWVLHKDLDQDRLPGFDKKFFFCRGINNRINNPERQANFFASCLLMPRNFVKEALKNFKAPLYEYDIKKLSDKFFVSKQAMKIRLVNELHLFHGADGVYYKSKEESWEAGGQLKLF